MYLRQFFLERLTWLRSFYPVMFAHKPLCRKFAADVIKIKNFHLCRSCLFLYSGILLFGFTFFRFDLNAKVVFLASLLIIMLSCPLWYGYFPRLIRDLLRLFLGGTIAAIFYFLLMGQYQHFTVIFAALLLAKMVYGRMRKRLLARSCSDCPELAEKKICSGFELKHQRMIHYEKQINKLIHC